MMSQLNSENRDQWKKIIQEQQNSGLTTTAFCLEKNIKPHQFTYFKSVIFPRKSKSLQKSPFSEVREKLTPVPPVESRIVLYYKDLSISFEGHQDLKTISNLCFLLDPH